MNWWDQLDKKRGSRPRCVLLMDGPRQEVACQLTQMVGLRDVIVSSEDKWMPRGKPVKEPDGTWNTSPADEAKLGDPNDVVPTEIQQKIKNWWLAIPDGANTPNWDIASTCSINGKRGLLLVEAKAHHKELQDAEAGKAPGGNEDNRKRIGESIAEANRELLRDTGADWRLSRDSHYQMSNRFAWAWKLTQLNYPVVLIYLGFLNADEMREDNKKSFADHAAWEQAVKSHSLPLFPETVWDKPWTLHDQSFFPLIRSAELPYDKPPAEAEA